MATTFCRLCGAKLIAESKFCANCGQPVYVASTAQQRTDYVDLSDYVAKPAQSAYQQSAYLYEQPQPATPRTSTSVVSPTPRQVPAPVYYTNRKEPGIAAILSFFWAGLGQIYNGQLLKGIGFIILYAFSVLLCFILIGFIILPIVWIIGIWDAYRTAQLYNEREMHNERLFYASLARR
jgi:TM2 domain-containing membrane protein YozV